MTTTTYKGCTIHQTQTTTTVQPGNRLRRLYEISGRFEKDRGQWPFLTSRADCREWINDQIDDEEIRDALRTEEN